MSYYGIKNLKVIKTDNGYNVSCMAYDSSLSDYKGNRIWEKVEKACNHDFQTKEELEEYLFRNFLDGNFHTCGGCGKYQCLSWNNCKLIPSEQDKAIIEKLHDNMWDNTKTQEERTKARETYNTVRYDIYRKLWKQYLADEKANKDNKFIIMLDVRDYTDVYVKKLGSRTCGYSYYKEDAKVFKGNPTAVLENLNRFSNHKNIRILEIKK